MIKLRITGAFPTGYFQKENSTKFQLITSKVTLNKSRKISLSNEKLLLCVVRSIIASLKEQC